MNEQSFVRWAWAGLMAVLGACLAEPEVDVDVGVGEAAARWRLETRVDGAQHRVANGVFEVGLGSRGVPIGYRIGDAAVMPDSWTVAGVPPVDPRSDPAAARAPGPAVATVKFTHATEVLRYGVEARVFADGRVGLDVSPTPTGGPGFAGVLEIPLAGGWWPGTDAGPTTGPVACFDARGAPPSISVAASGEDFGVETKTPTFEIVDRKLQVSFSLPLKRFRLRVWPSSDRACAARNAATLPEIKVDCGGGAEETATWGADGELAMTFLASEARSSLSCELNEAGPLASLALTVALTCDAAAQCPGAAACVGGRCELGAGDVTEVAFEAADGRTVARCREDAPEGACPLVSQWLEDGRLLVVIPDIPAGDIGRFVVRFRA